MEISFSQKLLENFNFVPDRECLAVTHEFISGDIMSKLKGPGTTDEEAMRRYHHQCLRSLDWSFSENIVKDPTWLPMFAGSILEMEHHIQDAFSLGVTDPDTMRDRIPLDSIPFKYPKRKQKDIHALPKDDEVRIAFQALFLFLLRPHVPLKYATLEDFLLQYPQFNERSVVEQDRLRNTANWMDLSFYTIQPRNNKTFILNLIPRIVEGRNARYITGSGQTRTTADRVDLFRMEGNCEKIKRPPRKKREVLFDDEGRPIKVDAKVDSTNGFVDNVAVEHLANMSGTNGSLPFGSMIIPYYKGFPGFSLPSGATTSATRNNNTQELTSDGPDSSSEVRVKTSQDGASLPDEQLIKFFPNGIPIVMIPQLASEDNDNQISKGPQYWNMGFPQGVQLTALPSGSELPAANGYPLPPSYAAAITQLMMQQQKSPSNGNNGANSPVFFYQQMYMKPSDKSTDACTIGGNIIDYSSLSTRVADEATAPKKKKRRTTAKSKILENIPVPLLHRSSSVGSTEGGLEMLLAAAGDLEENSILD